MSIQQGHKKDSSDPSTLVSTRSPSTASSSRPKMTNESSATTISHQQSRKQTSSDSVSSSGQDFKHQQSLSDIVDDMPEPKYRHQEFSAWKQYMSDGSDDSEKPDDKFILWKKRMLGEDASETVGKKTN